MNNVKLRQMEIIRDNLFNNRINNLRENVNNQIFRRNLQLILDDLPEPGFTGLLYELYDHGCSHETFYFLFEKKQ